MRTRPMRRQGFTLVEMMVSVALIVLIMAIVSQAFVDGLESFRQLKGIGDLQEELRSAIVPLRNDLLARHISPGQNNQGIVNTRQKLSDPVDPTNYLPGQGYFRIQTGTPGSTYLPEGSDSSTDSGLPSTTATSHILSFTIFITGSNRYNWMAAPAPFGGAINPPGDPSSLWTGQGAPPDYSPAASQQLLSQSVEVCWFLAPLVAPGAAAQSTATPPNGGATPATPLYALYRRQRLLVPNNSAINTPPAQLAGTNLGNFPEVSCKIPLGSTSLYFSSPADVLTPAKRAFMDQNGNFNSVAPMGTANGENPVLTTSDLVVSNVISFDVQVLFAGTYQFMHIDDAQNYFKQAIDPTVQVTGVYDTATTPPSMYRVLAIQITLRIWDPKTEQTRQVTMIQDM